MIIENMWYPATVNKRSLRWARRGYQTPLWELVWFAAPLIVLCIFSIAAALTDTAIPWYVLWPALLILAGYMSYERRRPLQKHVGVPLDGLRLQTLRLYATEAWHYLDEYPIWHAIVDDYLADTRSSAICIAVYERRRVTVPDYLYTNLHVGAEIAAWQIYKAFQLRGNGGKSE